MIDFSKIEQYRENNRIEAKRALGGLPESIWETYSAFANTLGGILLLGVEEQKDKTLHTVDLPDPEWMVEEFWNIVNDPDRTSVNILSPRHVRIENVNGDRIIVITIPRAQRYDKPVHVGGDPISGTYRRSGEGDYRCTREEVMSMFRDAAVQTRDMKVLDDMGLDVLHDESILRYRIRMEERRPGHAWEELGETEFLCRLGAAGMGPDGAVHPTAAGLLMFGTSEEIVREFPHYHLEYREYMGNDDNCTDTILSDSKDWSGNLHDFYFRVCNRLIRGVRSTFREESGDADDTAVHKALREALANSLVNADYCGCGGLVIVKRRDRITVSNPGAFRIGPDTARSGGVSDPRNAAILRMFHLIQIGNGVGGGIPGIYAAWKKQGWALPTIEERFRPETTVMHLPLSGGNEAGSSGADSGGNVPVQKDTREMSVAEYLTDNISATCGELARYLEIENEEADHLLREMAEAGIVVTLETGGEPLYKRRS
ncbi:MAG: putative DNA binding domain-containing protein [Eubacteriales bacterium]|nr:putative DNA binding domain-containing protein [Eubacteriales bacterium]